MAPCGGCSSAVVVEHRLVPALVGLRARLRQRGVDADGLQRRPGSELPLEVLAGDELAEPRVERDDVVVLEVDLDERLPVVVALVQLDAVEQVAREVELARRQPGEVLRDVARAVEQQAVPVLDRRAAEVEARLVGEMRRAEQLALEVVGPAVDRADDVGRVALALEHQRLSVPADVRQELDAARVADERLRVVASRQDLVVADLRDHQLVADVAGRAREQRAHLGVEDARIAVPVGRKLRDGLPQPGCGGQIRHDLDVLFGGKKPPTQPNNPGCLRRSAVAVPPRTALLSRPLLPPSPGARARELRTDAWLRRQKLILYGAFRNKVKTLDASRGPPPAGLLRFEGRASRRRATGARAAVP